VSWREESASSWHGYGGHKIKHYKFSQVLICQICRIFQFVAQTGLLFKLVVLNLDRDGSTQNFQQKGQALAGDALRQRSYTAKTQPAAAL
jgi:hypothetical protein